MKSVVVTGVSGGIGKGIASVMMEAGWRVFGSTRKTGEALDLQTTFGDRFVSVVFDVEDEAAVKKVARHTTAEEKPNGQPQQRK